MSRLAKFRLRGLGDAWISPELSTYGIDADGNPVNIDPATGDVYDMDGNLMTDLSHVNTSPAGVTAADSLVYSPDFARGAPAPRSSSWNNFTAWLGQPIAKGWPPNGVLILGLVVVAGFVGGGRRRGR